MDLLAALAITRRVAELQSFSRAADSLGLPKASVSAGVSALEAHLGTRLLHRTTRRVSLTADGASLLERAVGLLDEADEIQSMFRDAVSGRIRVDMATGIARHLVVPALPRFLEMYPDVRIELGSTDVRVDPVRDGYDCVLRVGGVGDSSLVARRLGRLRVLTVASPAYLERHGTPHSIDDLAGHRLVGYTQTLGAAPEPFEYVDADGVTRTIPLPASVVVNSAEAYHVACVAGLGLVQAPESGLRELLASGVLREVLPDHRAEPMPLTLLYPHRRAVPRRVRLFMDWLADTLRPHLVD